MWTPDNTDVDRAYEARQRREAQRDADFAESVLGNGSVDPGVGEALGRIYRRWGVPEPLVYGNSGQAIVDWLKEMAYGTEAWEYAA